MNPQTQGTEEQGPSRVPFVNDPEKPANKEAAKETPKAPHSSAVNDPGNEDPGSELSDAQVPLIDEDTERQA